MSATVHDIATTYVQADDRIREIEESLKQAKAEKKRIEEVLFTAMLDDGAPSVELFIDGPSGAKARVFPSSRVFARRNPEVEPEVFLDAVRRAGYADLVKENVNSSSLAAVVRELAKEGDVYDGSPDQINAVLPAELQPVVKVDTTPILVIRRS